MVQRSCGEEEEASRGWQVPLHTAHALATGAGVTNWNPMQKQGTWGQETGEEVVDWSCAAEPGETWTKVLPSPRVWSLYVWDLCVCVCGFFFLWCVFCLVGFLTSSVTVSVIKSFMLIGNKLNWVKFPLSRLFCWWQYAAWRVFFAVVTYSDGWVLHSQDFEGFVRKLIKGDTGATKSGYCFILFFFIWLGGAFPSASTGALHVVNMLLKDFSQVSYITGPDLVWSWKTVPHFS